MRRLFFLLIYIMGLTPLMAQPKPANPPKWEARAVWLTTIGGLDWPHSYAQSPYSAQQQQQELLTILDKLQRAGINQVLLQTRVRATTIFPSIMEPWDGCLSGTPGISPGYDALKFAIDECHRRGMELHAWVVVMPIGKWNSPACKRLRRRYPNMVRRIGAEGYMNPEKSQTAQYMADFCEEIVRNYDVDGIHLDYIRYPETWKIRVSHDRARGYITNIVRAIHDRVKAIKPYVKMSCSPIGKFDDLGRYQSQGWNAYSRVCQDAQGWLRDGLMDELFPMMYFRDEQFYPFAIDWQENSHGRILAPGLGIYMMAPDEKNWDLEVITREMETLRNFNMGHTYFRSKFLTDNTKGIYDFVVNRFDNTLSLVPPMTWERNVKPARPYQLTLKDETLSWKGSSDTPYYNIYCSRSYPVDISDARNLVACRMTATAIKITRGPEPRFYAITAMDRYGNESDALQQEKPQSLTQQVGQRLLKCDGKWLQLPTIEDTWDAPLLIVKDLTGKQVGSYTHSGSRINVSSLDNGMYQLYSMNKRGVLHRLGFFRIKRW